MVGLLYRKELRDFLRDRRTVVSLFVIPLLIGPVISKGLGFFMERSQRSAQEKRLRIAIQEPLTISGVRAALQSTGAELVPVPDAKGAAESGKKYDAAIAIEGQQVKVYGDFTELAGRVVFGRLRQVLERVRTDQVRSRLQQAGVDERILAPFSINEVSTAPPQKANGVMLGQLLGMVLVMLMMQSAMLPAVDTTAGEKERRTMETLLVAPVPRESVVLAKILTVFSFSLVGTMLYISSYAASFALGTSKKGGNMAANLAKAFPTETIVILLLALLPLAFFLSSVATAVCTPARSTREGQSYLMPLLLVSLMLSFAGFLPGLGASTATALIPVANFSLLVKSLLSGEWTFGGILLTTAVNLAYAGVAFWFALRNFRREEILFRS